MLRDRKANRDLADLGWTVVRVWEHEIATDLDAVVQRLADVLREA